VQKRVDGEVLETVRRARARGVGVAYDCDDLGEALAHWAPPGPFAQMLELADVITTNTAGFCEALKRARPATPVELVPDTIDYHLARPIPGLAPPAPRLRVLWFGNRGNLPLLERYLPALWEVPRCELIVCSDLPRSPRLPVESSRFRFVPWSLQGFPRLLRSCHLSLLMHDGSPADRAKSNNRMIASIAWGVPAVVSGTGEYQRTAALAGIPQAVFDDPRTMRQAIEAHRSARVRQDYLSRAQPVIWAAHSPRVIARRLREILSRHCLGRRPLTSGAG
jgi:hypothetical protein